MVTLEKLNSILRTLAVAAGATKFLTGYHEDMFKDRKALTAAYPLIRILPPVQTRERDPQADKIQFRLNIACYYLFNSKDYQGYDGYQLADERLKAWDNAITILNTFLESIHDNANLEVVSVSEEWQLIPEGQTLENTITVNIPTVLINAFCTIT